MGVPYQPCTDTARHGTRLGGTEGYERAPVSIVTARSDALRGGIRYYAMYVPGQPFGRRVLAGRLRALRGYDPDQPDQEPRFSREKIAEVIMTSQGQYKHYETGARIIAPLELRTLAEFYGLPDEQYAELVRLRERANQPSEYASYGLPERMVDYLEMEAAATEIHTWQNVLIPGILQVEPYMRRLFQEVGVPASETDQRVRARLKRQDRLAEDAPQPLQLSAVIAEEALLRCAKIPVQVARLAQLAQQPNIEILIIPLWRGPHAGLDGSFAHLRIAEADFDYEFAYQETASGAHLTDKAPTVGFLHTLFKTLRGQALDPTESLVSISRLVHQQ